MEKVLVANRGEIALRIMKTLKKMGIATVAVYSDADRSSPHVLFADEAVNIGPPPSSESYLRGERIIRAALDTGASGIHPGYGFLSENAGFASQVEEAGLVFIGPTPESMRIMGSKLAAKECVKKYNIPMVPGLDQAVTDITAAKKVANDIGYPILIKASAGGGGKGMRVVHDEKDFDEQMKRAGSEALSSFGDGSVFIEKFVESPRHIEIQVLADKFGNTVHLFERECSIQRRHQKVVEEAPSAILSREKRKEMGEAAVLVAKSCGYVGAGTVEFLVDEKYNFYFLEMNTRLQVEHPVTEMITGVDLVAEQVKVARGEPLSFTQDQLEIRGHALELRVYAEDPFNDFLPSVGKLQVYKRPEGAGIRLDDGFYEGMDIPIYYDPMIAKLVVHGETRIEAIEKMKEAISEFEIKGVSTTLPFGTFVMEHPAFRKAEFDTRFISRYFIKDEIASMNRETEEAAAKIALYAWLNENEKIKMSAQPASQWKKRAQF